MSVTKAGADDHNCGFTNNDLLHQAICRLVAGGHHGRRRRRQRPATARRSNVPASYNEVITVSALADTDGKPGGARRQPLLLVGRLRQGRHVRRLQQLRRRRRPHRAGQVHLVDACPGRATATVGHVDGGPDRDRRGRALQGEPPERDAGRGQGSARVPRQPRLEDLDRPGLDPRAAARRVAARRRSGRSTVAPRRGRRPDRRGRHDATVAGRRSSAARRSSSGSRSRSRRCPTGWTASLGRPACSAGPPTRGHAAGRRARRARRSGRYHVGVSGTNQGRTRHAPCRSTSSSTTPTAERAGRPRSSPAATDRRDRRPRSASSGRPPPTRRARSPATRSSRSIERRRVGPTDRRGRRPTRDGRYTLGVRHDVPVPRPGRGRRRQLEPVGRDRRARPRPSVVDDRSAVDRAHGVVDAAPPAPARAHGR